MMYFSRIRPRPGHELDREIQLGLIDGYGLKRLIWAFFSDGPDRGRDFLYRYDYEGNRPRFFTLSSRKPRDESGRWLVETKEFSPRLSAGGTLFFSLRANPVRSKKAGDGRQVRHDVVMDLKKRGGFRLPSQAALVQEAGEAWLAERADKHGFELVPSRVKADGYRRHSMKKSKSQKAIQLSTIDYEGFLKITNPDRFTRLLWQGIGPAKSFGCGLMLVRRG